MGASLGLRRVGRIQGGCRPLRIGDDPLGGRGLAQAYPGFPNPSWSKGPGTPGRLREQAGPEAGRRQEGAGAAWARRNPADPGCPRPGTAGRMRTPGSGAPQSAPRGAGGRPTPGGERGAGRVAGPSTGKGGASAAPLPPPIPAPPRPLPARGWGPPPSPARDPASRAPPGVPWPRGSCTGCGTP